MFTPEHSNGRSACLVVGSDSTIGSAVTSRLRSEEIPVLGTTRHPERVSEANLFLNLAGDVHSWSCPIPVSVAVICAGVSSVAACALDPVRSKLVNVRGIAALAERLIFDGAFVIFLSSSHVFDGLKADYLEDEPTCPVTEYGRQKAEVEQILRQWNESVAVVRLTKILGPVNPLFSSWMNSLKRGNVIKPFSDMRFAPIPIACVTSLLRHLIESRIAGVWHVSGNEDVSYSDAARLCASLLHASQDLVQPVSVQEAGYPEVVMSNTTLNTHRFESELGMRRPDAMKTLEKAFTDPQALTLR